MTFDPRQSLSLSHLFHFLIHTYTETQKETDVGLTVPETKLGIGSWQQKRFFPVMDVEIVTIKST